MKKVLFIMMLGMMFGQTKLETRVYEINQIFTEDVVYYFNWEDLIGYDIDKGIVNIFNLTFENIDQNCAHHIIKFGSSQFGEWGVNIQGHMQSYGGFNVLYINEEGFSLEYEQSCPSYNDNYISIEIAITAEFPEEDTGYIEEGFEYCINEGNNLVSYPCDNAIPIAQAIPSSETFLDAIIGEGVAASYLDGVGWVGSLGSLQSGDGYWFQANTNVCFQYECSE